MHLCYNLNQLSSQLTTKSESLSFPMSTTMVSDQEKIYKRSIHRRNDSSEIEVFEAARYFSGATEVYHGVCNGTATTCTQKTTKEDGQGGRSGGRISLDMPPKKANPSQSTTHQLMEENQMKEKKEDKQPNFPSGKLAGFLNSLFSQTTSSKKKKNSKPYAQTMEDIEESQAGGARKRRNSVSHLWLWSSTTAAASEDAKPIYSSSSSSSSDCGFRTPPSGQKEAVSLRNSNGQEKPIALKRDVCDDKRSTGYACLDKKIKFIAYGFSEKERIWPSTDHMYPSEEKGLRKCNDEVDDEGAESDSSSDLFELEICDLGNYSSGVSVQETSHMDSSSSSSIKGGAPVSSTGAI